MKKIILFLLLMFVSVNSYSNVVGETIPVFGETEYAYNELLCYTKKNIDLANEYKRTGNIGGVMSLVFNPEKCLYIGDDPISTLKELTIIKKVGKNNYHVSFVISNKEYKMYCTGGICNDSYDHEAKVLADKLKREEAVLDAPYTIQLNYYFKLEYVPYFCDTEVNAIAMYNALYIVGDQDTIIELIYGKHCEPVNDKVDSIYGRSVTIHPISNDNDNDIEILDVRIRFKNSTERDAFALFREGK